MKKLFKKFVSLFKRKYRPEVCTDLIVTAGTDLEGKYSLSLQQVNGIWCLCVHKCTIRGGLHYTSFNKDSFVIAIPINSLYELLTSKRYLWR